MILVTTDYIEGKTLEMLGIVGGATIQSKHIGKDIGAGFKTLVGGELRGYTEMMEEARSIAEKRMVENAEKMCAIRQARLCRVRLRSWFMARQ